MNGSFFILFVFFHFIPCTEVKLDCLYHPDNNYCGNPSLIQRISRNVELGSCEHQDGVTCCSILKDI